MGKIIVNLLIHDPPVKSGTKMTSSQLYQKITKGIKDGTLKIQISAGKEAVPELLEQECPECPTAPEGPNVTAIVFGSLVGGFLLCLLCLVLLWIAFCVYQRVRKNKTYEVDYKKQVEDE